VPGRPRWTRLAGAAGLGAVAILASGCAIVSGFGTISQANVIGDIEGTINICASKPPGCGNGNSGLIAVDGSGQLLIALQARDDIGLPETLVSQGGSPVTFTASPTYTAEVQRLMPAPAGARWAGYISPTLTYAQATGPQSIGVRFAQTLRRGADGSPFPGPGAQTSILVGSRLVTPTAPSTRPVTCGSSLQAVNNQDTTICWDGSGGFGVSTRDLGVLAASARTVVQSELAAFTFPVRYAGPASSQADFALSASSTLPGSLFAVTPDSYAPPANGSTEARVAVGVPAGARPGAYKVTLTARLGNGQTRSATSDLTVRAAPPGAAVGGAGGNAATGAATRLRLTTILPRRLSAKVARLQGVVVLIGATEAAVARVRLFQGRATTPKASKLVRLKVPGPAKVVLRSRALRAGRYRVVIRARGLTLVRRAALTR
jgi:hypothetical protein